MVSRHQLYNRNGMPASSALLADLSRAIPPARLLTSPEDLIVHGYDGTWLERTPDLVVAVADADEIAAVLCVAARHHVPVVPRGGGSGLAGGSVAFRGGIVLSTTLMGKIVEIDREALIAVV